MRLGVCATVRPLCWLLAKSKYALGMRRTLVCPRIRMTLASLRLRFAQGTKPSAASAVAPLLPQGKEVCAQVCAELEAPMVCLAQSSFETGYAPGMRQPHSSLVILFQLEHGGDSTTGFAAERQVCDDCFHQSEAVPQVCGLNLDMSRRLLY